MLTTQEVADKLSRPYPTIALWVRQGRFKNAVPEETPRGRVWWIPESDLRDFSAPTLGRPPKSASGDDQARMSAVTDEAPAEKTAKRKAKKGGAKKADKK